MNLKDYLEKHAETLTKLASPQEAFDKLLELTQAENLNLILDDKQNPEWIPKTRFDEVNTQKSQLKTQVGELSNELETLKKAAKGNEELTKKIEELQGKNLEWEQRLKAAVLDSRVRLAALKAGANDPDDILAFLDKTKLALKDDQVEGLEDQLKALKEGKPYLFKADEPHISGVQSGGDPQTKGKRFTPEQIRNMTPKEINKHWDAVQASLKR